MDEYSICHMCEHYVYYYDCFYRCEVHEGLNWEHKIENGEIKCCKDYIALIGNRKILDPFDF